MFFLFFNYFHPPPTADRESKCQNKLGNKQLFKKLQHQLPIHTTGLEGVGGISRDVQLNPSNSLDIKRKSTKTYRCIVGTVSVFVLLMAVGHSVLIIKSTYIIKF